MPQLTQGLIIAALIGLLLAVIVGYYLRQGRVNELTGALQQSQKRQEELEKEHEQRLRTATQQLQKDYEAQLAEKMEQYQAQFEERRDQLESEYRARQSVIGDVAVDADSTTEQRIRKQYETRLKEAATKIQQAYEQHLQDKLAEARSQAQQDYDQRLAAAIAHYQDEDQTRQSQAPGAVALGALVPDAPAVAGSATPDVAEVEARLQAEYDQRLAQMQQDYEARLQAAQSGDAVPVELSPSTAELELNLRRELEESLRVEYEQKLAEKIEHYQDELTQRTLELEQAYEARLQLQVAPFPEPSAPGVDEPVADLDMAMLEGAMPPETAIADEAGLLADSEVSLDMNEFSSTVTSPDLGEGDADLAALLESEPDSAQADGGLDIDADRENLGMDAPVDTALPETIADFSELNFDDPGEFSPETTQPEAESGGFGLAELVEGETVSGPDDGFGLESSLDLLEGSPDSGPDDELGLEPSLDLLGGSPDSEPGDEFSLEPGVDNDSLDLSALLDEPIAEPSAEFAGDEFAPEPTPAAEAVPAADEGDFGLAGLLENDPEGDRIDDIGLDTGFNTDSLDLSALLNEPASAPSDFAIDEFAPETPSSGEEEGDFGLAALLEGESDSGQVDDFGLDNDFNTDNLDLDALLNTPTSEPTSDELLDDLDDLSNLS